MADEEQETLDAAVQDSEETTDEESQEESFADDSSEEIEKLQQAYEDQRKRAEKLEKKLKEAQPQKGTEPLQANTENSDRLSTLEENFKLAQEGYSLDDAKFIQNYAKTTSTTVAEAKEASDVVSVIEARRKAREADNSTPGPSNAGGTKEATDFRKAVGSEKANSNEKQRAFEERMKNLKNRGAE